MGYVARDLRYDDPTQDGFAERGEPGIRAELARHKALRSSARLNALVRELPLWADDDTIRRELAWAISDVASVLKILNPK